jgi:hypothetical protein
MIYSVLEKFYNFVNFDSTAKVHNINMVHNSNITLFETRNSEPLLLSPFFMCKAIQKNNKKSKDDEAVASASSHVSISSSVASLRSRASSAFKRRKKKEYKASSKRRSSKVLSKIGDDDGGDDGNQFIGVSKYFCDSLYFFQCFGGCATESMIRGTKKQEDEIMDYSYPGTTSQLEANANMTNEKSRSWIAVSEF